MQWSCPEAWQQRYQRYWQSSTAVFWGFLGVHPPPTRSGSGSSTPPLSYPSLPFVQLPVLHMNLQTYHLHPPSFTSLHMYPHPPVISHPPSVHPSSSVISQQPTANSQSSTIRIAGRPVSQSGSLAVSRCGPTPPPLLLRAACIYCTGRTLSDRCQTDTRLDLPSACRDAPRQE